MGTLWSDNSVSFFLITFFCLLVRLFDCLFLPIFEDTLYCRSFASLLCSVVFPSTHSL